MKKLLTAVGILGFIISANGDVHRAWRTGGTDEDWLIRVGEIKDM